MTWHRSASPAVSLIPYIHPSTYFLFCLLSPCHINRVFLPSFMQFSSSECPLFLLTYPHPTVLQEPVFLPPSDFICSAASLLRHWGCAPGSWTLEHVLFPASCPSSLLLWDPHLLVSCVLPAGRVWSCYRVACFWCSLYRLLLNRIWIGN